MSFKFSIVFFFVSLSFLAQTPSLKKSPLLEEAEPRVVGMSAERLARIDSMCTVALEENEVPGIVALVARKGKIVYHKAFGSANAKNASSLKQDAIFRIASQTKAITSTGLMMLWEQGKFQLDDPVSKYIPEFKNPQVLDTLYADGTYETIPANKPISIRHLLTHTSGIGYGQIDGDPRFKKIYENAGITDLFTTQPVVLGDNIKKLAKLPLHHHPGEQFTYGESIDVAGYLIEILSGKPLDQYLQTHIFEPLGMEDTYFYLPEDKTDRLVSVQTLKDNQWKNYEADFYDVNYPKKGASTFFSGGAGLSSTAMDYARFLQMYLNEGEWNGQRLLSRTTVDVILSNQIGDIWAGSGAYHGLAFSVVDSLGMEKGGKGSTRTFEWGGYFNTQYFADPKEELIGIIMKQTQELPKDDTAWKFRQIVLSSIDD